MEARLAADGQHRQISRGSLLCSWLCRGAALPFPSWPAVAARERGGSRCDLLCRRGAVISCGWLQRFSPAPPAAAVVARWCWWRRLLHLLGSCFGSFSDGYGGLLRCPDRNQRCRAPLPLLLPPYLFRRRRWCGGFQRRPRRNLEIELLDRIAFCTRSRILSTLLQG
jgi:hypothetical protein